MSLAYDLRSSGMAIAGCTEEITAGQSTDRPHKVHGAEIVRSGAASETLRIAHLTLKCTGHAFMLGRGSQNHTTSVQAASWYVVATRWPRQYWRRPC